MNTVDENSFREVLGHFPTGVTVVTANSEHGPVGVTIGSFFSVSLHPPMVGFCIVSETRSWAAIAQAGSFCVNILAEDQKDLCYLFAGKAEDKFAGIECAGARTVDAPVLPGVLATIECNLAGAFPGGDHTIVLGDVRQLDVRRTDIGPMVFSRGSVGGFTQSAS